MLIDTHAHVNFNAYREDGDDVIKRSLENGILVINVGSQYSTSRRAVFIAEKYPKGVYAAIGLHPIHLSENVFRDTVDASEEVKFSPSVEEFEEEKYLKLGKSAKVVAIGEIGLDYFHNKNNINEQKEIFGRQIDLAQKLNLPIIIHCREAHSDVLEIIKEKKEQYGNSLKGVVHCFSGRLKQAKEYVELGFLLGFNGIITFARDYDKVVKVIDMKYVVLETDCPYLAPIPFRGKRNEPAYVKYVMEKIAEIKGIGRDEVAAISTENAKKIFNLDFF